MGCDIHEYVEVRDPEGRWRVRGERRPDPEYDGEFNFFGCPIELGRCYPLFSILANVRNGYGFAGADTGDGFKWIADPRGLPEDCDPTTRAESDKWGSDGHSHSWLTVAEILAFDWTQITVRRGYVNGPEYEEWSRWDRERGESPNSWCSGVGGGGIRILTEDELKAHIAAQPRDHRGLPVTTTLASEYTLVSWSQPYYKCVRKFWSDAIPVLLRLGKPEDVRLVFWFDN